LHEAISSLPCGVAFDRQEELAWPQQVEDAVGIFFISLTRSVLHGLAIVPYGLAVHQADLIATAFEPFVEGLPVDTGWCHGDQDRLTPVCDQVGFEGLFQASEACIGVGKFELTTAHGGLRS
jgi:hypothetical protein